MIEKLITSIENNSVIGYYNPLLKKREPKKFLISVIIPVMGRINFLKPLVDSLNNSIKKSGVKINITIVEHSEDELFRKSCKELNLNYYWIKKNNIEQFNKSLCHNIGAILNKNSDYFLFHDLDCLVFDDFFINIIKKISNNEMAFQTFKNRRLLYLPDDLTKDIIDKKINLNDIDIKSDKITVGFEGAPGGSICVNKETFKNVGGFDPELFFGYSPEDEFFWNKIETFVKITSTNNEVLHMSHENLENFNNQRDIMRLYADYFNGLTELNKIDFINNKKTLLLKYLL
jgi:predicted glycosyltransferase involved in capsule biosynthesis